MNDSFELSENETISYLLSKVIDLEAITLAQNEFISLLMQGRLRVDMSEQEADLYILKVSNIKKVEALENFFEKFPQADAAMKRSIYNQLGLPLPPTE